MSEQTRRTPREVPNSDNIATRLSELATMYIGECNGMPFPMKPTFHEGHRLNAREARALSAFRYARACSTANSAVTRGPQKDLSDADKVAYLTKYVNEDYAFTDALGKEFATSALELAVSRVLFNSGVAQGKITTSFDEWTVETKESTKRQGAEARIMTDPALADKYEPLIRAEVAAMLAERHTPKTRKAKADESDYEV